MSIVQHRVSILAASFALALVVLASGMAKMAGSSVAGQESQGGLLAAAADQSGGEINSHITIGMGHSSVGVAHSHQGKSMNLYTLKTVLNAGGIPMVPPKIRQEE